MVVSVRAPAKSHAPRPHVGKSGCTLENFMQQRV